MAGPELKGRASIDDKDALAAFRRIREQADKSAEQSRKAGEVFTNAVLKIGTAATAAGVALAALATVKLSEGIKEAFDLGRSLEVLSDRTGISVGRLQMLTRTFEAAGLEADDTGTAINRMQKFLQEAENGETKNNDLLRKLHLSFLDLHNLASEKQFEVVGKAVAGMAGDTARGAAAQEIFSRSGGRLLAIFKDPAFTTAGPLSARAQMLEKNAADFAQASIALSRAGDAFKTFSEGAAGELAKPLTAALEEFEKVDLSKYGRMFADSMITGATAVVGMLLVLKKADLPGQAERFAKAMGTVGKVGSGLTGITGAPPASMFADMVMPGSGALLGLLPMFKKKVGDIYSTDIALLDALGSLPDLAAKLTSMPPSKGVAALQAASQAQDQMTLTDSTGRLDDMTSTGVRMRARLGIDGSQDMENSRWKPLSNGQPSQMSQSGLLGFSGGLSSGTTDSNGKYRESAGDTGENYRQNAAQIRSDVQWKNPLLQGDALNAAVAQEQKRQRDQKQIDQYRSTFDIQHPAAATARKSQEEKARLQAGATSADVDKTTEAVNNLIKEIKELVSK